jgi:hypothetical protein
MENKKITGAIESICHNGCTTVNAIITSLEKGEPIDQINDLNKQDVSILIKELKSIMDVYNKRS